MNLNVGPSKMLKMRYRKKQQCLRKITKQKHTRRSQKISMCVTEASEVEKKKVNESFESGLRYIT